MGYSRRQRRNDRDAIALAGAASTADYLHGDRPCWPSSQDGIRHDQEIRKLTHRVTNCARILRRVRPHLFRRPVAADMPVEGGTVSIPAASAGIHALCRFVEQGYFQSLLIGMRTVVSHFKFKATDPGR
jgi:hypothetical protein